MTGARNDQPERALFEFAAAALERTARIPIPPGVEKLGRMPFRTSLEAAVEASAEGPPHVTYYSLRGQGMFRRVVDASARTLKLEILRSSGEWEPQPSLFDYFLGEIGAEELTVEEARELGRAIAGVEL